MPKISAQPPTIVNFPVIPTFTIWDGNHNVATVLTNIQVSQIKHIVAGPSGQPVAQYDYTIDFDFKNHTWNLNGQGNGVYFTLLVQTDYHWPLLPQLSSPVPRDGCYYGVPSTHKHTDEGSYFDTIRELATSVSMNQDAITGDIGPC
jgi:hypothetical protein